MRPSTRALVRTYRFLLFLVLIFAVGLSPWLLNPRWFLDPVRAVLDRESLQITLIRETPASRRFAWLDVWAARKGEARLLGPGLKTCPMPPGDSLYEVIGGIGDTRPPRDTLTFSAAWIAGCLGERETIYSVEYRVRLQVPRLGLRLTLPRPVNFDDVFAADYGAGRAIDALRHDLEILRGVP